MFRLIPLGTNGFIPTFNRHTMSFMLLDDSDEVIVLDAGSGLARLLEPGIAELLSSKKRLNIILSHYHLDHVIGLTYLPGVWRDKPTRLFAPSRPHVDAEAVEAVDKLLNPPLFSLPFDQYPGPSELVPVVETGLEIGLHTIEFFGLQHPGGSMGIKIDKRISYITDTVSSERYHDFISGSEYLLHEIWMTREEARSNPMEASRHSTVEDVIDLARTCGVKNLIPIHFHPTWTDEKIASSFAGLGDKNTKIILPLEGSTYELS